METLRLGSRGAQVEELQQILLTLGYYEGKIDGIYGHQTQGAVMKFQKQFGLVPDGIVGPKTYEMLQPFLLGYTTHIIGQGDTLYKIAKQYHTTVAKIVTANPGLNPFMLSIGTQIIVPYSMEVVPMTISYTYEILERNILGLKKRYPFLKVDTIGKSIEGKNLYRIQLGAGPKHVSYNGSHHANEWITSPLLMKWIERIAEAYSQQGAIRGYNIENLWNQATIDIIPMVNPDGVNLVINGVSPANPYYQQLIQQNNGRTDFSNWKANIVGVDLNRNYPAAWEEYKQLEKELGITGPGPELYGGPAPESEPETKAMADYTRTHPFLLVLAYHTQGEVIFWQFKDFRPPQSLEIAKQFSKVSGYEIAEPALYQSYAGYKDWFIQDFIKPGYTIEAGRGVNPLPIIQLPQMYDQNEELLILAAILPNN
ncbi:MAG: LysM peptidoglycan-binding domain-containing protein [Epulopiscium sp.]|nr:LysM peptidoglycan-binding domain-containing protein [Candidatus Epulonipiscium sp.]